MQSGFTAIRTERAGAAGADAEADLGVAEASRLLGRALNSKSGHLRERPGSLFGAGKGGLKRTQKGGNRN